MIIPFPITLGTIRRLLMKSCCPALHTLFVLSPFSFAPILRSTPNLAAITGPQLPLSATTVIFPPMNMSAWELDGSRNRERKRIRGSCFLGADTTTSGHSHNKYACPFARELSLPVGSAIDLSRFATWVRLSGTSLNFSIGECVPHGIQRPVVDPRPVPTDLMCSEARPEPTVYV